MGRLGVRHAVALLRSGTPPPPEILTRVEMIDLTNVDTFSSEPSPVDDVGDDDGS
jgi:hypothetical protein